MKAMKENLAHENIFKFLSSIRGAIFIVSYILLSSHAFSPLQKK